MAEKRLTEVDISSSVGKKDYIIAIIDGCLRRVERDLIDGKNAYEYATEAGFLGSEDEFAQQLMGKSFADVQFDEKTGYLHFYNANGEDAYPPVYMPGAGSTGGAGGGSNNAELSVANKTGWTSKTLADSDDCEVTFTWSSVENEMLTGDGTLTVKVNGSTKLVRNIQQGDVTVNIRDCIGVGANVVRLTITDIYGNNRTLAMNVTVVSFSLTSSFDDSLAYSGNVTFPYTPTGSTTKTMQFILDGSLIGSAEVTTSGRQQNFVIPAQSHGAHSLEVYFTATVNDTVVESNHLFYDIIFEEAGKTKPIIASSFNVEKTIQYYTVSIPWLVYTPELLTSDVTLYVDGEEYKTLPSVDRTKQIWPYRADTPGEHLLEIVTGSGENETRKTFTLTVAEADINVSAEENDLDLYLTSYGRSNTEANPGTWEYGNIAAEFQNFNWASDGWQLDDDHNSVLRIAGDARVNIPLNIFGSDFRTTGKTIEVEFATKDIMNYESEIISCFSVGTGLVFTPQKATLTSEQSSLFMQYKEDEHVRVSFVIEKKSENRLIYIYINGILSGVVQYPESDDFQQGEPVGISIGSNDCTIDLYCIRVYSNSLTRYQMLDNWIADTQSGYEMMQRYTRNNIYDDYGKVVIEKLPPDLSYMVLEAVTLPQYKGDKKTVTGYYVDPLNPDNSFTFEASSCDVQGTSSQYYKRKNYKIKFSNGFTLEAETIEEYQMREDAIPVNTFTFKADVASCEGANNVELVRLYNDICPYKTPPQIENPDVRQGIDGFPMVMFWSNGEETVFLGKYNFNNDKGTEEVFGFKPGDVSWEIRNNTSARSMFKSADFSGTAWLEDFEGRYPDGNTDPSSLKELAEWLVSTDQAQATGASIQAVTYDDVTYTTDTAAYRRAKFKAEADEWLELDAMIFSYVFTELFLLVDSRAKNNFPTRFASSGKWCVLPYDMDTAIGTNNEGLLVFDYNLEDTDTVNGANVYNGQDSVLYINLRDAFPDEIEEMYGKLRSDGLLSYDIVEKRFEDHQALWPEAIFNEDAYYKYIDPLIIDGEATYLSMCQGSKESQRKWWLFNRFRYIDSKYTCGDALTNTITLRAYQKSNFEITPYADIYPCVAFDSTRVKDRGHRNEVCAINSPAAWDPNGSDAVVTVYSADQLKDIGDISAFKVGYADFSKALKLQRIKVGDASTSYSNPNMTELYVGNNTLLKVVDARNCPNLAVNVDLSGCSNIEEAYFDGTAIIGVSLPNGGMLKKLHLPSTITNLTLLNQRGLEELVIPSYANITTLRLENVGDIIDSFELLKAIPVNSRVRLIGFDWTLESATEIFELYDLLDTMRGLDENQNNVDNAQMMGKIRVETLTSKDIYEMRQRYSSIEVIADTVQKYTVTFYNYDGTLLGTVTDVNYGDSVTYIGDTPYKDEKYEFIGWNQDLSFIKGDTVCTARFRYMGSYAREILQRTFEGDYVNERITTVGTFAFYRCLAGEITLDFHKVTSIGTSAFANSAIKTIILRADSVCTLANGNLGNIITNNSGSTSKGFIYVPKSLLEDYKVATNWTVYAARFRAIEDYPEICGGGN